MARTDLNIPQLGSKFVDIRDSIPGDSFNWSWVRPLNQVKYLAIHHTASPDTQTPTEIANYHINNNGWGGIGYHFVISKDGTVYYVGDISTARANVANLNEQVLGICLIGNFTSGRAPTNEQLNSANKLCDFFINNYPDLSNINSWDSVKGHKELPGQSTTCPGDNWQSWKEVLARGIDSGTTSGTVTFNPPTGTDTTHPNLDRGAQITEAYRKVLGRDPDMGGLQTYTNSPMTIEQIVWAMVISTEHQNLLRSVKDVPSLQGQIAGLQETVNHQKSQIDSLQMSLATVNGQLISLKETLGQKDAQINELKSQLTGGSTVVSIPPANTDNSSPPQVITPQTNTVDTTVTILQALYKLYNFVFNPNKI